MDNTFTPPLFPYVPNLDTVSYVPNLGGVGPGGTVAPLLEPVDAFVAAVPGFDSLHREVARDPYVPNSRVACEPFPENVVNKEMFKGVARPQQRGALTKLKVVFRGGGERVGQGDLFPGYDVYVKSDLFKANWAMEIYTKGEKKFILVPIDQIMLIDPNPVVQ